jgi:hypothetical protein
MTHSTLQTSADPGRIAAIESALERVLNSEALHKSSNLRHLLRYLVARTIEGHQEQIKESIIAIDVFSRREDFDGRLDNIVRVQAHRLRKLLESYYAEEGKAESVRFSIPKGSYVPQFEFLPEAEPAAEPAVEPFAPVLPLIVAPGVLPVLRGRLTPLWILLAFLAGAASTAAIAVRVLPALRQPDVPTAVKEIWGPVFEPGVKVIASYSNPAFLRVEHSPLFLLYHGPLSGPPGAEFEPGPNDPYVDRQLIPKGQRLHFSDGWTGVGEVMAVNRLTLLGARFRSSLTATPSRLLQPNDLHDGNVIFIGSTAGSGGLAEFGLKSRPFSAANNGRIQIREPKAGESASYSNLLNPQTGEVMSGFVLFSVLPGMEGNHLIVCSSGLSTAATWMGIEYTTNPKDAAQLTAALRAANGGGLPRYFQAIVRADFVRGVASKPVLVAVRPVV